MALTEIHNMIPADGTVVDDNICLGEGYISLTVVAQLSAGRAFGNSPHAHSDTAFH